MKIVVAHNSPDWDAITSVWLIKRFLDGWQNAKVEYVPAGSHSQRTKGIPQEAIEKIGEDEIIHVDTGLGPLDHHQTPDETVCGASLTWDYVQLHSSEFSDHTSEKVKDRIEAISRLVKVIVDIDHFREVFWDNPTADYHDFSLIGILDGMKYEKPNQDDYYMTFGMEVLDGLVHSFENKIWAEREIATKGKKFKTRWGEALGFDTINDSVLTLAQKMGYVIVVRKDPRKGYVRIKARPSNKSQIANPKSQKELDIDLTLAYEKLSKIDPDATWFLHVSKKMLLNGTTKNPLMKPTRLSLGEIIKVLETI